MKLIERSAAIRAALHNEGQAVVAAIEALPETEIQFDTSMLPKPYAVRNGFCMEIPADKAATEFQNYLTELMKEAERRLQHGRID